MVLPKMRWQGMVLVIFTLLLAGVNSYATTFLDVEYGTPTATALPKSMAMGGTGVAFMQGSQAVVNNPAMLATYKSRFGVDAGLGFWHVSEDRSVPLFDSFESYVRDNTYALNRNAYAGVQGGVLWRVSEEIPMTLAVGIYDRYDFDFNYFEEIRDPSPFVETRDQIIRTHSWDIKGLIRSASVGYGSQIWGPTHLGVSVHRYFGDFESAQRRVVSHTPDVPNAEPVGTQELKLTQDFSGWGYSVGAHGAVNEHLDLAISWEGEFTVDGTATATVFDTNVDTTNAVMDRSIRYPGTLNFGLSYRPRNILRTTFNVEAVRRFWEGLEAEGTPIHLIDTWDLRLGLEHIFYNQMPLRLGFRYMENYADIDSDRSIYSAGVGYLVAGWQLDVTGQYARQTSRQPFLFNRDIISAGGNNDFFAAPSGDVRVEDSVVSLLVGVSRGF